MKKEIKGINSDIPNNIHKLNKADFFLVLPIEREDNKGEKRETN